jgi:hypothetical protein
MCHEKFPTQQVIFGWRLHIPAGQRPVTVPITGGDMDEHRFIPVVLAPENMA